MFLVSRIPPDGLDCRQLRRWLLGRLAPFFLGARMKGTIADAIRRCDPELSNAEVAKIVGSTRECVKVMRWTDRNREKFRLNGARCYHRNKRLQDGEIPWCADDVLFLEHNWSRMSATRIGDVLGRSRNSIIGKVCRLGLKK